MATTMVIFGPLFATAIVVGIDNTQSDRTAQDHGGTVLVSQAQRIERCNIRAISDHLARIYDVEASGEILFTYLFWGSEIVWRTPYDVVGAPYTNLASLTDTSKLFHATSDAEAAAIVRQRGIDQILVCTGTFERYPNEEVANLHKRLVDRSPPPWLEPIELPAHLAPAFRLYRVNPETLPR
jgi:hypothetical protein